MSSDQITLLLLTARAEIRSLERDVATLPPDAAEPFLDALERLSAEWRQLMRHATAHRISH
jgi:hypothetical protein